jgi:hypothetical protein
MTRVPSDTTVTPGDPPSVAAGQHRRALALLDEKSRDVFDDRGLAAAAHPQVADADDRPLEPVPTRGIARVPRAPPRRRRAVRLA